MVDKELVKGIKEKEHKIMKSQYPIMLPKTLKEIEKKQTVKEQFHQNS